MLLNLKLALAFVFVAVLVLVGCTQTTPPGPAERIGKGVDEIFGGVKDFDQNSSDNARGYDRSDHRSRDSSDSWGYDDRRPSRERKDPEYVPECDPLFDPNCKSDYWRGRDDGTGRGRDYDRKAPVPNFESGTDDRRY
jgi:hypothetical protein